ncbi:MAG: hypothetical protein WCK62_02620 [Actinomycetes bacterium]|jgi:hypothetical protein
MTELKLPARPIKGPGLTMPGVVILQFLIIFLAEAIEYKFTKVGLITGIAILVAFAGALYLGRTGTSFAAVVNPPIAFLISTIILMITIGGTGLHVTKIGLDLVTSLAGVAPFLAFGAAAGWVLHLAIIRKERKSEI